MKLTSPIIITSRLMAGIRIGTTTISIDYDSQTIDGRDRYRFFIDSPELSYESNDLASGCQGGSLQEGLESLLSFLGAAAESHGYQMRTGRESDNSDLFPPEVIEWADANSDEIAMLQCELSETPDLIDES